MIVSCCRRRAAGWDGPQMGPSAGGGGIGGGGAGSFPSHAASAFKIPLLLNRTLLVLLFECVFRVVPSFSSQIKEPPNLFSPFSGLNIYPSAVLTDKISNLFIFIKFIF